MNQKSHRENCTGCTMVIQGCEFIVYNDNKVK